MIFPCRSDLEPFTVWYKIKVCSESRVKNLENEIIEIQRPVWAGVVPIFASVAALGCDIYFIGGEYVPLSLSRRRAVSLSDVYKVDVTTDREGLLHTVPSMQFSRTLHHTFLLDGKIYVVGGHGISFRRYTRRDTRRYVDNMGRRVGAPDVEVYDPTIKEWEALPPPPIPIETQYICAALENPNRILVASSYRKGDYLVFYQYNVEQGCWKMLHKPKRQVHWQCPTRHGGRAVTVGNTLYWITRNTSLLAYDVVEDVWLSGDAKGQGISSVEYDSYYTGSFIHLEGERFAIVQTVGKTVEFAIIDVYRKEGFELGISVVSIHKYKTEYDYSVESCFLL